MEKLTILGLRIDEHEQLKIISEGVEHESQTLAQKCHQFLDSMESLMNKLEKTETLLESLSKQSEKTKIVGLAAGITSATRPQL